MYFHGDGRRAQISRMAVESVYTRLSVTRTIPARSAPVRCKPLSMARPPADCCAPKENISARSRSMTKFTRALQRLQTPSNKMTALPLDAALGCKPMYDAQCDATGRIPWCQEGQPLLRD